MLVKCYAATLQGIQASTVTIEVDISRGINFFLVGLPDSAVKESQRRIESALRSGGLEIPKKRVVINMAPADIRKEGSSYDLPMAIGMLAASGLVSRARLAEYIIMGELSLDGELRRIRGALNMAIHAKEAGFRGMVLPDENTAEAAVIDGIEILGMKRIGEVVEFLNGKTKPEPVKFNRDIFDAGAGTGLDYSDVKGQPGVKRALEIAASGMHNLLMIGAPGSGKSMLVRRLPTILPPLSIRESIETTRIHSVAGKLSHGSGLVTRRPFRDPHHTISDAALVGGGAYPLPGEISLAHNGVLFLDELPEFKRNVLEVLRQPMEGRTMTISRANYSVEYPASFMLVAAMNPCPCGNFSHPDKQCVCPPGTVQKYLARISGPLLDRIDIHIEVAPVPFRELAGFAGQGTLPSAESSSAILDRVMRAREIQQGRFANFPDINFNSRITPTLFKEYCQTDTASKALLQNAMEKLKMSARAYDRILKVARTIADLDASGSIKPHHLAEAIQYRSLDRLRMGDMIL